MRRRLTFLLVLALSAAGCGSAGSDDPSAPGRHATQAVPAAAKGVFLVDCWDDELTQLTPTGATLGASYLMSATAQGGASIGSLCYRNPPAMTAGLTAYSPDGALVRASTRGDDLSTHAGYLDVATGQFTDVSARMPYDANGVYQDKGSGAEQFAGPIKDQAAGFGPDGTFYLIRANQRYAAAAPGYDTFTPLTDSEVIGAASPDGHRRASNSWDGLLLSTPSGTPATDGDSSPGYAVVALRADTDSGDAAAVDCATVDWIDDDHLLCGDSGEPTVIALSGGELIPAADSCFGCRDHALAYILPTAARTPLAPVSSRQLFGFLADPASGTVYFLADNGSTMQLYSATVRPGSIPTLLGSIPLGTEPSGSNWYTLLAR